MPTSSRWQLTAWPHGSRVTPATFSPAPRSPRRGHPVLCLWGTGPAAAATSTTAGRPHPGRCVTCNSDDSPLGRVQHRVLALPLLLLVQGQIPWQGVPGGARGEAARALAAVRPLTSARPLAPARPLAEGLLVGGRHGQQGSSCGRSEHRVTTGQRPLPPTAGAGGQRKDRPTSATSPSCRCLHALPPLLTAASVSPWPGSRCPANGAGSAATPPPKTHSGIPGTGSVPQSTAQPLGSISLCSAQAEAIRPALPFVPVFFSLRVGAALKIPLIVSGENGRAPCSEQGESCVAHTRWANEHLA